MKRTLLAAALVLAAVCDGLEAGRPPSPEKARPLLERAAGEVRKAGEPMDFDVALRVSRHLARFNRPVAVGLLRESFRAAKAQRDRQRRLACVERVAIYAGPIDADLSHEALDLIRANVLKDHVADDYFHVKILAVDLVLAHGRGAQKQADTLLGKAKSVCKERGSVGKSDVRMDCARAFVEYAAALRPTLGAKLWQELRPKRAWEQRLTIALNRIHYRSEDVVAGIRDLMKTAPSPRAKADAAVALYKAGRIDEAIGVFQRIKPTEGIGEGWPLGNLIKRVGAADPRQATRIALTLGSPMARRDGMSLVFAGAAGEHPEAIPSLLEHMDNAYRRDAALSQAAASLAKRGDIKRARELAAKIGRNELKATALAAIAEATTDRKLLAKALRLSVSVEDIYGSGHTVAACAIRALGAKQARKLIEQAIPEIRGKPRSRNINRILLGVADADPAWVLDVFKRAPDRPAKGEYAFWPGVANLLPKLAPVDPEFVAKYIEEHGKNEKSPGLAELKRKCALQIARDSAPGAERFAKRLGAFQTGKPYAVTKRDVAAARAFWRIRSAGKNIDRVLDDISSASVPQWRYLVEAAAISLASGQNGRPDGIQAVLELTGAMQDRSLADKALTAAALRLYEDADAKKALKLVEGIRSPWRRADALCSMARRELDPRPQDRLPFLFGWKASQSPTHMPH